MNNFLNFFERVKDIVNSAKENEDLKKFLTFNLRNFFFSFYNLSNFNIRKKIDFNADQI